MVRQTRTAIWGEAGYSATSLLLSSSRVVLLVVLVVVVVVLVVVVVEVVVVVVWAWGAGRQSGARANKPL